MSDFFKDASKLSWWVGVVLVGLVLNVVASYIRNWMDRTGRFVTERRRRRSARYREEMIRQADCIRGQPFSVLAHLNRSIKVRLSGVNVLVMELSGMQHRKVLSRVVGVSRLVLAGGRRTGAMEDKPMFAGGNRSKAAPARRVTCQIPTAAAVV